jgi:hypothetical protein
MTTQNQNISSSATNACAFQAIDSGFDNDAFISPSNYLDGQPILGLIQASEVVDRFPDSNGSNFYLFTFIESVILKFFFTIRMASSGIRRRISGNRMNC